MNQPNGQVSAAQMMDALESLLLDGTDGEEYGDAAAKRECSPSPENITDTKKARYKKRELTRQAG